MSDRHWSDEQLLSRLYGVEPGDAHLDGCSECLRRLEEISLGRRRFLEGQSHVSAECLAEQRRAIRGRIADDRPRPRMRLAPALAALLLLAAALVLFPRRSNLPVVPDTADSTVFEETLTMASGEQPEAVEPIQALFEVQQ